MTKGKLVNIYLLFFASSIALVSFGQDTSKTAMAFRQALQLKDSIPLTSTQHVQGNMAASSDLLEKSNEFNFMHQKRSFDWQYYSGIIIFFMVIAIVVMGLVLSYKQFKLNERMLVPAKTISTSHTEINTVAESTTLKPAEVLTTNTMELSKDGIKISTAVIGLIILTLSIAFFFLYLKYVYPISFVE